MIFLFLAGLFGGATSKAVRSGDVKLTNTKPTTPTPQAQPLNDSASVITLARTLYGEARGENYTGMQAVANVIMNRVNKSAFNVAAKIKFGIGVVGVCKKKWQFSIWLPDDPSFKNSVTGRSANGQQIIKAYNAMMSATTADPQFRQALTIARLAVANKLPDLTKGSTYYLTKDAYNSHQAKGRLSSTSWSFNVRPKVVIGDHNFFDYNQIA